MVPLVLIFLSSLERDRLLNIRNAIPVSCLEIPFDCPRQHGLQQGLTILRRTITGYKPFSQSADKGSDGLGIVHLCLAYCHSRHCYSPPESLLGRCIVYLAREQDQRLRSGLEAVFVSLPCPFTAARQTPWAKVVWMLLNQPTERLSENASFVISNAA